MASSQDTLDFVRKVYSHVESEEGLLAITLETQNLRTQNVFFGTADTYAIFMSTFADSINITAEQVFIYTSDSPWGIKLIGTQYCVVHLLPLENLGGNEIREAFDLIAFVADNIEKAISDKDKF